VRWTSAAEGREEEEIELSWAGETARHVGSVVYHWLQCIDDDSMRGWDAARVETLRHSSRASLSAAGYSVRAPTKLRGS
jgi:hypothetical protein